MTGRLDPRTWDATLRDVGLAVGLTALSLVPVLAGARDIGSLHPGSVALLLLQTVPLAARSRVPVLVLLVTGAATIAHAAFAGESLSSSLGALFALYSVADLRDRRISAPAAVALGVAMATIVTVKAGIPGSLGSIVQTQLAVAVSWLLGVWSRERRAYIGTVEQRAARAEREREDRARRAVEEERARIARELHDVVTHHVSVIVIQAGAARRALERRPTDAGAAIEAIDTAGRQALTDMRRMLGILGSPGAAAEAAGTARDGGGERLEPMPGLDRLGRLLESVRAAGIPVELTVAGDRRPLDPGVELSAYRIVQEALTNVMKHAGGSRASVAVTYTDATVELTVEDEGPATASEAPHHSEPGRGVIGMRERVAMLGGRFEAGPVGRGFRVHASLPTVPPSPVVA